MCSSDLAARTNWRLRDSAIGVEVSYPRFPRGLRLTVGVLGAVAWRIFGGRRVLTKSSPNLTQRFTHAPRPRPTFAKMLARMWFSSASLLVFLTACGSGGGAALPLNTRIGPDGGSFLVGNAGDLQLDVPPGALEIGRAHV